MKREVVLILLYLCSLAAFGVPFQAPTISNSDLPFTTRVRKSIVEIKTNCLVQPSQSELSTYKPSERKKWSLENLSKMKPSELAKRKTVTWFGTGFILSVPSNTSEGLGFLYLITNRHVRQPGIEDDNPCFVTAMSARLNHKPTSASSSVHAEEVSILLDSWGYPDDPSVDLAFTHINVDPTDWDFTSIPVERSVDSTMIANGKIAEGDQVFYSGLFFQYEGKTKLEPIVRSGTIAMLPTDAMNTTLKKPGHIFFTEAHAFGGNSGSPMFVTVPTNRDQPFGHDTLFLGVVAGQVYETSKLKLQTTGSLQADLQANSNISVVVPAEEVRKLVYSEKEVKLRNEIMNSTPKN